MAEQRFCKAKVGGSNPLVGSRIFFADGVFEDNFPLKRSFFKKLHEIFKNSRIDFIGHIPPNSGLGYPTAFEHTLQMMRNKIFG